MDWQLSGDFNWSDRMRSGEWPRWFKWAVRAVALLVITYFALAFTTLLPVNTAGNAGIEFIGHLEPRPQADISAAYETLCELERARITRADFVESRGARYAVLGNFGVVGAASQHDSTATLNGSIKETWKEYEITVEDRVETWRLYLVRERNWWEFKGDWKICGIEFRGDQPADQ